ncbi:MAG: tRNA threonylcarbamoyladenosine biosynthesis protein TsaB [Blastocatellia bacterium]|nr:tRNA threonylcarbamoyladenosine biosynthesis protein TsaB [Blastocatellia bacterium]
MSPLGSATALHKSHCRNVNLRTELVLIPLILSLETATRAGSVCLVSGDSVLAAISLNPEVSHSTDLLYKVQESLDAAGFKLDDVQLFAAATGPGSFTGLRIGLATIKSFAATLGRPCAGVPTLEAVAHASGASAQTVALLPAGRGELFAQLFSVGTDGAISALDNAAHLKPLEVFAKYGRLQQAMWAGEGAILQSVALRDYALAHGLEFFDSSNHPGTRRAGWILAPACENLAIEVAAIAGRAFDQGNTVSAADLHAIYVRPSDAEMNQRWPNEKQLST